MLTISQALHDQMVAHCQSRYPKEACGILAAAADGRAAAVYPMTNVEDSPIGYAMDPKEQLQVERIMRKAGMRMIGIYHSHTASDAYPSSVDVGLAISPEISYILVSLRDPARPDFRSYRIDGRTVIPEPHTVT